MEDDKKLCNPIKEIFIFYISEGKLNLSDSDVCEISNLLWNFIQKKFGVLENRIDILEFDYISERFNIDKKDLYNVLDRSFMDIFSDKKSEFYRLFIIANKFNYDLLSIDEKHLFNFIENNALEFLNKSDFEDDEKQLFVSIIYNLLFLKINTNIIIDVTSYLGIGFLKLKEILGEYYKKIEKYTFRSSLIIHYIYYVYSYVLLLDISEEKVSNFAVDIENNVLSINDFIYLVLSEDSLYITEIDGSEYIYKNFEFFIEIIYNIALMRWPEEDELIFWSLKMDEVYNNGKSIKESAKYIAKQIMSIDEFNGLENYYKIFE